MHHGLSTKYHLLDWGWNYGEMKCEEHNYCNHNGGPRRKTAKSIRWYKRKFVRTERRRANRELMRGEWYD